MGSTAINLSSADVEFAPNDASSQSQPPSLSSADVEFAPSPQTGQSGPINPYANDVDMSKVPGAVPGMRSPGQIAGAIPVPPELQSDKTDPVSGGQIASFFGMDPNSRIGKFVAGQAQAGQDRVNEYLSGHPQPEHVIQDVDPVFGSIATGAYEAGAGLKDIALAPQRDPSNFMAVPNPKGLVAQGNLPIWNRPTVQNADGTHSSEYSVSFGDEDGHEVLVPTIVGGKFLTPDGKKPEEGSPAEKQMFKAAWDHYLKTGQNLGKFDNPDDADAYAQQLHSRSDRPQLSPGWGGVLKGANRTIQGAMLAGAPVLGPALAEAPIPVIRNYLVGIAAGKSAQKAAEAAGASPEVQELANNIGFFIPNAVEPILQLKAGISPKVPLTDPAGNPVGSARFAQAEAFGGRVKAVGGISPNEARVGIKVGPYSVEKGFARKPATTSETASQPQLQSGEAGSSQTPQSPPDGAALQSHLQTQTVVETAARAADIQQKAQDIAAGVPPPPSPPKTPAPQGMDDGHLTQQTVNTMGKIIQMLPDSLKPKAILEAIGNLAQWLFGKRTVIGPDGKAINVDSPKAAQNTAVQILNNEVDRQQEMAETAKNEKEAAAKQQQEDAEAAQQERQEALEPTKETESKPAVQIPESSPDVIKARQLLAQAPDHLSTQKQLDRLLRDKTMITKQVRDALVQQEILRRANREEDAAQTVMQGAPIERGKSREELQRLADNVNKGEHPFVHIPHGNEFKPNGVDALKRTPVKGAGAFSGTYYRVPEITNADIRRAARDKKDPQAALDALVSKWKGEHVPQLSSSDVHMEGGAGETKPAAAETKRSSGETLPGLEGKKVKLNLADGSQMSARHKLAELRDLTASHDGNTFAVVPEYPEGVQERSYHTSKPEQMKVIERDNDLKPELITNSDTTGATGPLIVTSKDVVIDGKLVRRGTVLGGNSRKMTLDRVYTNGDPSSYHAAIDDGSRSYGFQDGAIEASGVRQPVHVLEVEPPSSIEGLHRLGSLLNKPLTQSLDVFDQAVTLSKALSPETQSEIANLIRDESDADSTATLNAILSNARTGKKVVRLLEADGIITERNVGNFVDPSTGLLVQAAKTQLGNAMLATVLNNRELMEKTPPLVKQKLLGSIGAISTIITRDDGYNIAPALREAAKQYGELFRGKMTVEDGIKQSGMFGDQRGPVVTALIKKYDESIGEVRKAFSNFALGASMAAANGGAMLTGMAEKPEPYLDFNFAFGTELTAEQFDAEMQALAGRTTAEQPEKVSPFDPQVVENAKPQSGTEVAQDGDARPLAKGDKVTYTTAKGKTRSGEVAWTDGKNVRVKDGEATVNKKISEVQLTQEEPSKPEVEADATLVDALQLAFENGRGPKDYNGLKKIVAEFDGKEPDQLRMKEGQEAYEAMLNRVASAIVLKNEGGAKEVFDRMVRLYEGQPRLSIRTSTSIDNQAYSTPLPLAFIVDRFAGIDFKRSTVYEPTAGNGALLIAADPGKTVANEMNQLRASQLQAEGFKVSRNDATTWAPSETFDAVVANPPFGKLPGPVEVDGYKIVKLDHLIAAKAMQTMKDGGKAAIIIGAGNLENAGEVAGVTRPFFNWLYSHYNVVSDFELEGELYARQGASFPVRVIAIDGRVRTAKVGPQADSIQRLKTWGEVYDKAAEHLGSNLEGQRPADIEPAGSVGSAEAKPAELQGSSSGLHGTADSGESQASSARSGGSERPASEPGLIRHTGSVPDPGVGSTDITVRSDGDVARSDRLAEGESPTKAVRRGPSKSDGHSADALAEQSNQFQETYRPFSSKKDVAVMAPKAMKAAMWDAMERLSAEVGDVDQWLADQLGYPDVDTLHDAFMGLQVDSIALAIRNIQKGKGLISADQTGVGKGRQAAAVIRWAEMNGYIPVFITAQDQLFTDMQRDLHDIGSGQVISPLLFNADATITDPATGGKIFGNVGAMRPVFERIMETGELPRGRNAVYLTYSQVNVENRQRAALMRLAPKVIVVADEIHNAGGQSNTGEFMQTFLASTKGTFALSATYAKRPDNMPLYGAFTDMSIAIPDKDLIASAIAAGGAPLQAVNANQLAQAGQLVRRERSFDGISLENRVDEANQLEHERISDAVTEVLRAIVEADHVYHEIDFPNIQEKMKGSGGGAESSQVVVQHMEFSSVVHNLVKQLLLALKADDSANQIIKAIKEGKKPIFALENTMGSFLDGYVAANALREGDLLNGLNYSRILNRALERTRYFNRTDAYGNKERVEVPLDELSARVREAYDDAQSVIDNLDVDLPVSPIDHIRQQVEKAGYRIAEITGRNLRIDYSGEVPTLSSVPGIEKKDRVNTASQFNNGGLDALIINQAGSTGISLHASEKFRDQRPRLMIVGQPAGDVNIVMQILGRVNRTGQVVLPEYMMLAAALPAEMRPAINLAKKMKSLNANTSSNTRSATSVKAVDLMNKYGDQIVAQYLVDNPDMQKALGLPLDQNEDGSFSDMDNLAMKATGRSALLPVKEQRAFMDAISENYENYIAFLDETGQNDLEPRTYDFDAKEMHTKLVYQGTDPSSPFGSDAHFGEYSIKRQGKPFTPEEVEQKIAETFGDNMSKPPLERDTLAARELAEHIESLYKPYLQQLISPHSIKRADLIRQHGRSILNEYRVGVGLRIEINGETYNGIVTKIEGAKKPSGNPYAPSALQFTIAVNGALRQIRVPGSQMKSITVANLGRNANVQQLFQDMLGDSRQRVGIITGNLLGAYASMKNGVKGRIVAFTMSDGTVRQGILMPKNFDVDKEVSQQYALRSPEGALHYLNQQDKTYVQSKGGEVGVFGGLGNMEIKTKAAKVSGGRFFLDPNLRALVTGDEFVSRNGLMVARVRNGQELAALRIIMNKIALYPTPSEANAARTSDEKAKAEMEKPEPPKPPTGGKRHGSGSTYAFMGANPDVAKGLAQDVAEFAKVAGPATMDDLMKAAKLTTRTMKQAGREVVAALYPRALADEDAKDIMGRGIGHPALTLFRAGQLMHGIGQMFEGMPEKDQIDFVDRWQTGKDQPTKDLQDAQELMQSILEGQRDTEREAINLGRPKKDQIELTDRPNYFPNRYKVAPGRQTLLTEEEQIERMAAPSRRPLEGSKAFLKEQRYTLKKAVEEGAKPLGTPVDMLMRRLQEGAKFVAAKYVMHSYDESGIITFLKRGKKMPDGYSKIEDKIAKAYRPVETADGGTMFKETGEWVGQTDAIRLLNNYLSKDHIRGRAWGQSLVALKNATTEIRLGFSPFHYGTITYQNISSSLNVGLDKLYNQGLRDLDPKKAIDGLADLGAAMVAPYTAIRTGGKMIQYARNPDEFLESPEGKKFAETFPDFPHLQELLFAGGLRWGMPEMYRASLGEGFTKEIASGHLGKATLQFFPWLTRLIAKPLFEHYIPRSKWNFAVRMLAAKLDQYSYAIANGDMTEEQLARDVASATENRFGEFNFDNLYWNNTFRTANQLLFRSVSWKAGTWLSAGKAVKETFSSQAFNDRIYEKIAEEADGGDGFNARDFTRRLPQLGINAGGLITMAMFATVLGSVITRLLSGKWPWEWAEDDHTKLGHSYLGAMAFEAVHPRTGLSDKHKEPLRLTFPTDLKDYEHATENPSRYLRASLSDVLGTLADTAHNRDAFGNYVFNPADPAWKQFVQGLRYNAQGTIVPMSVAGFSDSQGPRDIPTRLERFSGVMGGAPKAMDRSVATNRALELLPPHTPLTPEQIEERQMTQKAPPTRRQILQAAREKNMTYLEKLVLHELSYKEAKDIFDNYATPEERQALRSIIRRKQESIIRQHGVAR